MLSDTCPLLAGRYQLQRLVAQGSRSEIWLASDNALARPVAIKIIRAEFAADKSALDALRLTARQAGLLAHENVARIYDFDEDDAGQLPYLVMEYADGPSLSRLLADGPMAPASAMHVVAQIAAGLEHVHEHGLAHGAVEPRNVVINQQGQVKLIGLGSRQPGQQPGNTDSSGSSLAGPGTTSASGAVTGTAADLHALGVLARLCLTGAPPAGDADASVATAADRNSGAAGRAGQCARAKSAAPESAGAEIAGAEHGDAGIPGPPEQPSASAADEGRMPPLPAAVDPQVAAFVAALSATDGSRPVSAAQVAQRARQLRDRLAGEAVSTPGPASAVTPRPASALALAAAAGPAQRAGGASLSPWVAGGGPPRRRPVSAVLPSRPSAPPFAAPVRGQSGPSGEPYAASCDLPTGHSLVAPMTAFHRQRRWRLASVTLCGFAAVSLMVGAAGLLGHHPARAVAPPTRTVVVNGSALRDQPVSVVRVRLRRLGLYVRVDWRASNAVRPGLVISVRPGGRIAVGSLVTVFGARPRAAAGSYQPNSGNVTARRNHKQLKPKSQHQPPGSTLSPPPVSTVPTPAPTSAPPGSPSPAPTGSPAPSGPPSSSPPPSTGPPASS